MVANVSTLTFHGIDVIDVEVQVHIASGIPAFNIVGLPDKTIAESRERVRSALSSIGLPIPPKRITINLAPANLVKEGSHFDLAIAVAILVSMDILPPEELNNYLVMGELSLDGSLTPVLGVLPAAIGASAREKGLICPYQNGSEAAWSGNELILAPKNLLELINHFKGTQVLRKPSAEIDQGNITYPDLIDIKGQETAKRALEIAAAGGHNMLMCGPPGAGKSMLAQRLPGLLPPMDSKEMLECSMIASLAGLLNDGKLQSSRPFRAPHHSCSMAAMVGGGMSKRISPGEISIAHHGVLFLDELPEFQRVVLDSLRQPIETGDILISRAHAHITYPAKFQLIAAMNPCRCGYLSDPERACNKVPRCAVDYQGKISGPLFDRIDIYIEVGSLSIMEIENAKSGESTAVVAARVTKARELQKQRYHDTDITINARLDSSLIQKFVVLSDDAKKLLNKAVEELKLSMRGYNRILKVARTIADLEEEEIISKIHIAEALSYRQMTIKRN